MTQEDVGRQMVSGEFTSTTAPHNTIPDATPEPVGWGTYASSLNVHFFLCHFIDMIDEVPGSYFPELFPLLILSQLAPSFLHVLTPKFAQIFKPLLPRLPSFTQRESHLMVGMNSCSQHSWAKCLSTPPGRIPGRSSSPIRCRN